MGDKPQEVQLTSLAPAQLKMLHEQLDQEIEHLASSMQSLKSAQVQFMESKSSLKAICPANLGKEIMVPLNSSLYVPGRLSDAENVLVDIGTGYFAEKNLSDAEEFFKRKADFIKQQIEQLQGPLQQKYQTKQIVLEVLQQKMMAAQQQKKA